MNPARAITLKLISVLIFTAMSTCIKAVSPDIPPGEAVFFRSAFALIPILGFIAMGGPIAPALRTQKLRGHMWRSLMGVTAMGLNFFALGALPLPEAIAIGYASPLLATVFAVVILGDVVRIHRWAAVGAGLIGVLVVLWPRMTVLVDGLGSDVAVAGAAAALGGAAFAALAMIFVRRLVLTERTVTIVFYFSAFAAVSALGTIPFGWVVPTVEQAAMLVAAGILGGLAQIFVTQCYRYADTATIAPFQYTSMLFGLVIGYALFDEVPTVPMLGGSAVIVGAGLYVIYRERQLGLERARARRAMTPQG